MTLCLLSYDPTNRRGSLTNAGQLAPYRISGDLRGALSLAALPLGISQTTFASREHEFAAGGSSGLSDDGFVETFDAQTTRRSGSRASRPCCARTRKDGAAALRDALSRPSGRTRAGGSPTTTARWSS